MKKRVFITIVLALIIIWNNYYPSALIEGTYVSNNTSPILEGPSSIDTLILFEDGSFVNGAWGRGKYEVNGKEILFHYNFMFGKATFHTLIDRPFFLGQPRLSLDTDLGFYYLKKK